jgi:hypothetical protein
MGSNKKWSEKEKLELIKFYEKGGPSYCSKLLNRTIRSCQQKAKQLNLKFKNNFIYNENDLIKIVESSTSLSDCIKKLNLSPKSARNYDTIKKYINLYNIDISHFGGQQDGLKKHIFKITIPLNKILIENSTYTNRVKLKERLYKEGLKQRVCEKCGQNENWNGEKMSLILDHINGVNNDNRLENLRIVCPNCNATLPTHCSKNKEHNLFDNNKNEYKSTRTHKKCICGKIILINSKFCVECNSINNRKIERPEYSVLLNDVKEFGYEGTGRKYKVSGNSIKKWIKNYKK